MTHDFMNNKCPKCGDKDFIPIRKADAKYQCCLNCDYEERIKGNEWEN